MKPIGGTSSWLPNTFPTGDKMGKSSGLRRVVSSGKYLSTYDETAKHVAGTIKGGMPFSMEQCTPLSIIILAEGHPTLSDRSGATRPLAEQVNNPT